MTEGLTEAAPSFLTFANTNIAANTGGETFLLNNGASNVLLEYLSIQGNVQSGVGGVINILGTTGATGNNNITITSCNISNFAGSNPYLGITSGGQSQSINNFNINITNNNIFDWGVNAGTQNSFGVLFQNTSASTVSGNSIYRTTPLLANAVLNDAIVQTLSGTGAGNTFTGNFIGGTAPLCGGSAFSTTTASGFYCIDIIDAALHTTNMVVTNNTIKNFTISASSAATIVFCGIFHRSGTGACTISGNQFGDNTVDASVSPSILFTNTTAATTLSLEGIDSRSGNGTISNNNVGGIRSIRTSAGLNSMNLIFSGVQGTKNITGNLVGSLSTTESRPNKLTNEQIEELKKLPNYGPDETAPKTSGSPYLSTTKDGKIIVLSATNDAKADVIEDKNSKTDEANSLNEKMRIEQERTSGKTPEVNKNTMENVNPESKKVNTDNLLPLPKVNSIKQKGYGDSPLATIANISQEAPAQLVPIFSSAFGGTIDNNTIANIVVNTGAVTLPLLNTINISNSSSPSVNIIVTNNTIRNLTFLNSTSLTMGGMVLATTYPGTLTCTGNNINTINAAPLVAAQVGFVCIQSTGTGFHNVSSNTISGLSVGGNENGGFFTGIIENNTAPATSIVNNNIIQNITLNSLIASTHSFTGINASAGTGDYTISGNTITNFASNSNVVASTGTTNAFTGIGSLLSSSTNSPAVNQISGNTITNAACNPFTVTSAIRIQGIYQSASTGVSNVTKNFITGFTTNSTATTTVLYGWYSNFGSRTTFSNNIIDLGSGVTTDNVIYCCFDDSFDALGFWYNNTFRVRGIVAAGITATICYYRNTTSTNVTEMKNNIFCNERTGGTGSHMAISNVGGNTTWATSDYNDYYSANPNTIGRWGSAVDLTLATLKSTSGKDARTFSKLPSFTGTDRINANDLSVSGRGTYVSTVTTDIDGDARPTSMSTTVKPVDVGADQYLPSGFAGIGNTCVLNGSIYQDGGLNAVEVVSGTFTVSSVKQYPGVRSPFNTMGKPGNNGNGNNNNENKGNNNNNHVKSKDGKSGGEEMLVPVNEPWIYWELPNYAPTSDVVLRFYYNPEMLATINENNLRVTYWTGTAWENSFVPQSINTVSHYIQVTLPQGYTWNATSHFAIEDNTSPLPVDICSFTDNVLSRDINLSWTTCQEVNNRGFNVERRALLDANSNRYSDWVSLAFVPGNGTSNEQHNYTYSDKKLFTGKYEYRLKQMDFNSNSEYYDLNKLVEIGKPNNADVSQNYPNPSNPKSKIDFQIPFDSKVSLKVYDELGKEVAVILDESKVAGFYTAEFDGSNLASGVYFYRIIADGSGQKFTKTMKMILVK